MIKEFDMAVARRIVSKLLTIPERGASIGLRRTPIIPILLNGPSGVGKTTMVEEIAEELKMKLIVLRLASISPESIGGVPVPIDNKRFRWLVSEEIAQASEEPVILFFDELNRSSGSVRNAAIQMIFERRVNNLLLHPLTRTIAAINHGSNFFDTTELEEAWLTRFAIINVRADLREAVEYVTQDTPDTIDFWNSVTDDIEEDYREYNQYQPIEPWFASRNTYFVNLIVKLFLNDEDFENILSTVLPQKTVKKIVSKYDKRKIEMILRGEFPSDINIKDVPAILNIIVKRELTDEQFLNVLRWLAEIRDKTGKKDAVASFLKRLARVKKEMIVENMIEVTNLFPDIGELYELNENPDQDLQ
jgi:GTPase SAR1 family protein